MTDCIEAGDGPMEGSGRQGRRQATGTTSREINIITA